MMGTHGSMVTVVLTSLHSALLLQHPLPPHHHTYTHLYAQSRTKGIASHASIVPIPVTFPLIMDHFPNVNGQFGDPELLYFLYNTTAEKRGQLCSPLLCFLLLCSPLSSQKPVCSDFSVFSSGTRSPDSKSLSPILLHMAAWKFHCGEPEAERPS